VRLAFLTDAVADIEKAASLSFDGVELLASAFGDAYKGDFDPAAIDQALQLSEEHGVAITALAYYDLAFSPAPCDVIGGYEKVFDLANRLGVQTVASMSGFDSSLDWEGNLRLFGERFRSICQRAEAQGLRLALENWMGFGGRLPFKPVNMGGSPDTWDAWFNLVPSEALGLEFDPSHLYWQGIDHIRALREFGHRVYHVHAKDTEMLPERRYRSGINGDFYRFRVPGYGAIDWLEFVSVLEEIGYAGGIAIEQEDPVYRDEKFTEGLVRGWQVLYPLIHPAARRPLRDG